MVCEPFFFFIRHILMGIRGLFVALVWFKKNFDTCNDRATLVKTWLPVEFEARDVSWLNQLIYDRALQLVEFLS